jgi:hypothetical protein
MGFGQQAAYGAGVANEHRPLSDLLVRNLTAYGTLGLRLDLSEQPDIATPAVTHALAAQIFYVGANAHVVGIQPVKTIWLYIDGSEDMSARQAWADRHANWARQMPRDVAGLWNFWWDSITTAAWPCSRIARRSRSMRPLWRSHAEDAPESRFASKDLRHSSLDA